MTPAELDTYLSELRSFITTSPEVLTSATQGLNLDSNVLDTVEALVGLPAGTITRYRANNPDKWESEVVVALVPSPVDRAVTDVLFWRALNRVLAQPNPNAAQLKLWADLAGHTKERPAPPVPPVLTEAQAWSELVSIGSNTLRAALTEAEQVEAKRAEPSNTETSDTN